MRIFLNIKEENQQASLYIVIREIKQNNQAIKTTIHNVLSYQENVPTRNSINKSLRTTQHTAMLNFMEHP
jgi:hypothetical protein